MKAYNIILIQQNKKPRKKETNRWDNTNNIVDLNQTISMIVLNIDSLNIPN